jgi:AcrR family transcriptional regulator
VYRRFPDKDALIDALFEAKIGDAVQLAKECNQIEDPWRAFETFMRGMCAMNAKDRGFKEALLSRDRGRERVAAARDTIAPIAIGLLERAQAAGVVREDLGTFDVPVMHLCVGQIADRTRDIAPDYWERFLTLLLDGIRLDGKRTPMPAAPLDREEFTEAMVSARGRRRA